MGRMQQLFVVLVGIAGTLSVRPGVLQSQIGPVRAVLFFSPTCPHCHKVINEDLPRIFASYGGQARVWFDQATPSAERSFYRVTNGQLEILLVDASRPAGGTLYHAATARFGITEERSGVPRLVVGDSVLVGSVEIPTIFPTLIQQGLAAGGIDWPDLEGLAAAIPAIPDSALQRAALPATGPNSARRDSAAAAPQSPAHPAEPATAPAAAPRAAAPQAAGRPAVGMETPVQPPADSTSRERAAATTLDAVPTGIGGSIADRFLRDPVGNGLAVAVLLAMIAVLVIVAVRGGSPDGEPTPGIAVLLFAAAGAGIAGYLTWVETSGSLAVCGPVGDCNVVQQSPYARVLGVIPVGLLGLLAYLAILAAWVVTRIGPPASRPWAAFAAFALALVGTVCSAALTFLEPFVIGATCLWCLASAVIITLLLLLTLRPAAAARERLRPRSPA